MATFGIAAAAWIFLGLGAVVSSQSCEEPHYQRCLMQLHEFSEKSDLIFAESRHELQAKCLQAQSARNCLIRYARKCIPLEFREEFLSNISGGLNIVLGLCENEENLKNRYLDALPCLQNYSDSLAYCKEKFERNLRDITVVEYENKHHLRCCSFEGYRRCLKMLLHQREECAEVAEEVAFRLEGDFSKKECAEEYELCMGSTAQNILPNLILLFLTLFYFHRKLIF